MQATTHFVHQFPTQLLREFNVFTIGFLQYKLHIVSKLELYDDVDNNSAIANLKPRSSIFA